MPNSTGLPVSYISYQCKLTSSDPDPSLNVWQGINRCAPKPPKPLVCNSDHNKCNVCSACCKDYLTGECCKACNKNECTKNVSEAFREGDINIWIGNYTSPEKYMESQMMIKYAGTTTYLDNGGTASSGFKNFPLGAGNSFDIFFTSFNPKTNIHKSIDIIISRPKKSIVCSTNTEKKQNGWVIDFMINDKQYKACVTTGDVTADGTPAIHFDFSYDGVHLYSNCNYQTCNYINNKLYYHNNIIYYNQTPKPPPPPTP